MDRLISADAFFHNVRRKYCIPCKKSKNDLNSMRCKDCWIVNMLEELDEQPTISPPFDRKVGEKSHE